MNNDKEKSMVPEDLPQKDAFRQKEIYQHPQPADQGIPLNRDEKAEKSPLDNTKEQEKTSKEEGLNEENSSGIAGAFEGFEDQQKK